MVKKQIGGDGYVINVNEAIGGRPGITRYSNNYRPVFDGQLLQNGGGNCGCSNASDDPTIFDLIQQQGGNKKKLATGCLGLSATADNRGCKTVKM